MLVGYRRLFEQLMAADEQRESPRSASSSASQTIRPSAWRSCASGSGWEDAVRFANPLTAVASATPSSTAR
jgi:hypothetical protein